VGYSSAFQEGDSERVDRVPAIQQAAIRPAYVPSQEHAHSGMLFEKHGDRAEIISGAIE
jgi:hypothetical protein